MNQQSGAPSRRLKLGFVGVGMGATAILPAVDSLPQIDLMACADINPRVREAFKARYPEARAYESADQLFADPDVEAVWIATPNRFHAPYMVAAAQHGKHVIGEKPMALSLAEAEQMVEAAEKYGVKLLCGHTLGFSPQVRAMRRVVKSGRLGPVRAINTWAFTDWMVAPRTPDEVDLAQGGGLIYRQVPHQADSVRLLADGVARSVRGTVGQWADWRPNTPGYYSAFIDFENGATANLVYNGYGHFLTAELVPWGTDTGLSRTGPQGRGEIRQAMRDGTREEEALKDAQRIGGSTSSELRVLRQREGPPEWVPNHIGMFFVTCEKGDIRHERHGISVYSDEGREDIPVLESYDPGREDLEELYDAVVNGKPVYHDGRWGMATLEITLAILQSAKEQREIELTHQVRMPDEYDSGPAVEATRAGSSA